jgi:hypothetical protein
VIWQIRNPRFDAKKIVTAELCWLASSFEWQLIKSVKATTFNSIMLHELVPTSKQTNQTNFPDTLSDWIPTRLVCQVTQPSDQYKFSDFACLRV